MASVLVTGAHGRTGQAVLTSLAAAGHAPVAFIRSADQEPAVRAAGAAGVAVGDLLVPESLTAAIAGMNAVVHIGPPMHPDEVAITRSVLSAAAAAEVGHVVYYSVMHPLRREVRHHRLKLDAEEAVIESGLPYTILQPIRYMQHVTPQWSRVVEDGVLTFPFNVGVRFSVADLLDLADAVAVVTGQPSHHYATYELAGPQPLSTQDMADVCSSVLGRPVRAEETPLEVMAAKAAAAGATPDRVEQMRVMNAHYDRFGFLGNANVLTWLLGRDLRTFEDYVRRLAA